MTLSRLFVVIVSLSCALVLFANAVTSMTTRDYVNFRSTETRHLLLDAFNAARYNTDDEEPKWKNLWSRAASQPLRTLNVFDEMFVIDEQPRQQVATAVALNLDGANNNAAALNERRQLNLPLPPLASPNEAIEFVKSYSWNGLSLLLVCRMSYCTHYSGALGDYSTLADPQLIECPAVGQRAIDATYFARGGQPHLVIAYRMSHHSSSTLSSKLYQWTGTRMVRVGEIPVATPTSVIAFDSLHESTMLLFTIEQSTDASPANAIYEFDERSLLREIQSPTNNPLLDAVVSFYPYNYAEQQLFLTINRMGLAEILLWNGTGFEKLMNLPDIQPFDQIRLAQIDDNDILLFISDSNALHVYKIEGTKVVHLNDLAMVNKERVMEITAWKYDDSMLLLLIKINADGTYQTELWQMNLYVEQLTDNDGYADAWTCLAELKDALDARAAVIKDFEISQSRDLSNLNNSSETFPLHLSHLIINDGSSVSVVEFRNERADNAKLANPQRVKEKLLQLQENMRELENDMIRKNRATLSGNVSIEGDAYFDELLTDHLQADYINGELANFENYLISGIDQHFTKALSAKLVSIEDLSVSSLCGSNFDDWMRVNDSVRSNFAHLKNAAHNWRVVDDDTIVIESELIMMEELHTKNLNGIEFNGFLENVFLIGKEQTVRGELSYEGHVQVMRLYAERVNNVSSEDLITRPNNQSLHEVFIDTLEAEQLFVRKINGVPIDNAARMSGENVIKGKVTLSNLIITDELTVNENVAIPLTHSSQVYDEIYIDGDLFIKNLELEDHSSLNISGVPLRGTIGSLVRGSWNRSGNQTIPSPIAFQKGAKIDRLDCLYLNGLTEHDFLYTDSTELSHLENVTFGNFHFNAVRSESSTIEAESFVQETNDHVTFYKPVHMRYLSVDRVFADKYNGIPIESVMRPNDLLELPREFEFETVRVDDQMRVDDLRLIRLNRKNSQPLARALRIDQNFDLNSLQSATSSLSFENLIASKLNGRDFEAALLAQESFALYNNTELTVDAEVTIEASLQVDRINNEQALDYTSLLQSRNASELIKIGSLGSLTVMENFDVARLNGQILDAEFFADALSRNKRQTLGDGRLAFDTARINYLTADAINNLDLSKLMYTDQAATLQNDVMFSNLRVLGDVKSRTLNGQNALELVRKLQRIPIESVDNLLVQGDVEWDEPSKGQHSLSRLLDNAVTQHQDQRLASPIDFHGSVVVESLYLAESSSGISQKIRQIVDDALIDNVHSNAAITLGGTKTFKSGLTVGDLKVDGNIDIENVNGLDIRRVSSQIFQKDKPQVLTAELTFLDRVQIARLLTHNPIHGVPLQQLAVVGQTMPNKFHFQQLIVDGDVSLYKLDGIDFDEFVKRRVTTHQDNEIFSDVQFLHSVHVSNGTYAVSVNEVMPENLVQNNADGTAAPIIIRGNKIFNSELVVQQNLEAAVINDFQVSSVYDSAILNGTDAAIRGALVFEGDVDMSGCNITVSGEINGLPLQRFSEIKYLQNRLALNSLSKGVSLLNGSLSEIAAHKRRALDMTVMLYLEQENKLDWHFSRVLGLKSRPAKNKTRLEITTAETHELCGLQDGCLCKKQFVVDVLPSGEYEIQEQSANNVTWTFYPPDAGAYGLKIISKSTSYSEQCSRAMDAHESSKVFWFKFQQSREILRRTPAVLINDYISDAQVFQNDGQLYLIVAIFYNRETRSHATDSLLYQFDLKSGKAALVQTIATNGAKSIDLFQIPSAGMHVLIGCVKGKAESLLLRFNPTSYQFQMIRTFATGGSKYVASLRSSDEKSFVILDNPDVRALQIFEYDENYDNFVDYQNIFFESRVTSLAVFYSGGDIKHSDAFVVTTTRDGWLYIYEYMFYGKFQLKMSHWADDIQVLTPFRHMSQNYLFAGFKFNSTVYKVIQQGYSD